MLGHNNGLLEVMKRLSCFAAWANAKTFPIDGANCRNTICNDPHMIIGSYVKGPNNMICRAWV